VKGLYQDNLTDIVKYCTVHFKESPLLYFSMISIFKSIELEYDNQGIPIELYKNINSTLIPLITECIDNPTYPSIEKLVSTYWDINTTFLS